MSLISGVSGHGPLGSCMAFSVASQDPFILYSRDSSEIQTNAISNIAKCEVPGQTMSPLLASSDVPGQTMSPHLALSEASERMHPPGTPIVVFRPDKARSNEQDETFLGNLSIYDEFNVWASEKCVPLVREITFENAEELTEEGLPFLILFHKPDDDEIIKKYNDVVHRELVTEKQSVNFLTADGVRFAHPLHHLGKSQSDLPLIAIDSFRHMYLFPDIKNMEVPGKLKNFLNDLHSGKLHREFHYGPDPVDNAVDNKKPTTPPESTFKKLAPSKNRYTLLRDEL